MDTLEAIYTRRSVRKFTDQPVDRDAVMEVLNAGRWAPSGLNNQPWRFVIVSDEEMRGKLALLTKYGNIINNAQVLIGVFLDREAMYNETKDHQGIGACLQNMLLAAHALGLGAVWLGEILNNKEEATRTLGVSESMELMAVLAMGHPATKSHKSERVELKRLILAEI